MIPLTRLASAATPDGILDLFARGNGDYLIKKDNQVLMNSRLSITEKALAVRAIEKMPRCVAPRVLISGLGMGVSLAAALDVLPGNAKVTVVEINPVIVEWCRGPLASVCRDALSDNRVSVLVQDVSRVILAATRPDQPKYNAIILDLYEGTGIADTGAGDPFYGEGALATARDALTSKGVLAAWTEGEDKRFEGRANRIGYHVWRPAVDKGGPRHAIYVLTRR